MDWCCSSTPRTPEYRTMNEERHARKAYWLVLVRLQFLTGVDTKGLRPSILWIEGQNFRFFHVVKELNNGLDRKSTRLNSSHVEISYAVFCLTKKHNTGYCY